MSSPNSSVNTMLLSRWLSTASKDGYSLSLQEDESHDEKATRLQPQCSLSAHRLSLILFVAITCYSILITASFAKYAIASQRKGPNLIYSPLKNPMDYQLKEPVEEFHDGYHSHPLFGDPSPEFDLAWIDRLLPANIRLFAEEFASYNQKGVLLADGSGYLATPTVYHNIHCLRYLHTSLYRDYYFVNETAEDLNGRNEHFRHCLNNLYYALTCNADMTMRVMKWSPHSIFPAAVDNIHQCVDWNSIDAWARERLVDTSAPGLLIHPTKGEVLSSKHHM